MTRIDTHANLLQAFNGGSVAPLRFEDTSA